MISCHFFKRNNVKKLNLKQKSFDKALGLIKAYDINALKKMIKDKDIGVKSVDKRGSTLLMHAVSLQAKNVADLTLQRDIVIMLLEYGSKLNATDHFGETALAYVNHPSIVRLLVMNKADVNLGLPIIRLAANRNQDCIQVLIEAKTKHNFESLKHFNIFEITNAEFKSVPQEILDSESPEIRVARFEAALKFIRQVKTPLPSIFSNPIREEEIEFIDHSKKLFVISENQTEESKVSRLS